MENTIKFKSRKEAEQHLVDIMNDLNKKGEFNIFVHQINNFRDFWNTGGDIIQKKIDGIMRYGLKLGDYASLLGTTNLACVSSSLDADSILNYDYHRESSFPTCVIAIPKFIDVDGEKVEYSTYKSNSMDAQKQIKNVFNDKKIWIDRHHLKVSIFDAIKGYRDLPKHYIVGILKKVDGGYDFIENTEHLRFANSEQFQNYQNVVAEKIKDAYHEYNSKDPIDLIVKSYQKEQKWREDQLADYD